MDDDQSLEATQYIRRGGWIILRAALPASDPESWPALWKAKFGTSLLEEIPDWLEILGEKDSKDAG